MPQLDVGTLKAAVTVDTTQIKKAKKDIKGVGLDIKKSFRNINRSLRKTGLIATAAFSLPLAMFATSSVKAASDAVEMTNVFNVAYRNIRAESQKTALSLANDFDLASSTSKKLLGDVGDLMIGFGLTDKAALSLSNRTLRIAGDLTSFRNIAGGIPAVTNAIFRGMLGISQALKPLGVAMNQRSKEFRQQIKDYMQLTGVTEQIARAEIVLQEVIKQSVNAVGDYDRTRGELANTTRRLGEMTKFMREEFGKILIHGLRLDIIIGALGTSMKLLANILNIIPSFLRPVIGGMVLLGIIIPPVVVAFAVFNLAVLHLQKSSLGLTGALKLQTFFLNRNVIPAVIKAIVSFSAWTAKINMTTISLAGMKAASISALFSIKALTIAAKAFWAWAFPLLLPIITLLGALALVAGSIVWAFKRIKNSIPTNDIKSLSGTMESFNSVLATTWRWVIAIGKTAMEIINVLADSITKIMANLLFIGSLSLKEMILAVKSDTSLNPFSGVGDIFSAFDKNMKQIARDLKFPKKSGLSGGDLTSGIGGGVGIGATTPSLSSAAIRGTSEAIKIENQRSQNKKVENNTKRTADNTSKLASMFEANSIVLMPANLTA